MSAQQTTQDITASQEQITIVDNFLTMIGDSIDWTNAPPELQKAYADAIQITGALLGDNQQSSSATTGTVAPTGGSAILNKRLEDEIQQTAINLKRAELLESMREKLNKLIPA